MTISLLHYNPNKPRFNNFIFNDYTIDGWVRLPREGKYVHMALVKKMFCFQLYINGENIGIWKLFQKNNIRKIFYFLNFTQKILLRK